MGVSTEEGQIVVTRMFCGPSSTAAVLVRLTMAAFDAAYAAYVGTDHGDQ
jgi:hypothetical protein